MRRLKRMAYFNKRYHPPGTAPGTLSEHAVCEPSTEKVRIIQYGDSGITSVEDPQLSEYTTYHKNDGVTWIHIQGSPSMALLQELGKVFQLHSLALEDVLNSGQRPKVDPYEDQLFIVMSLPSMAEGAIRIQQVSFFLHQDCLISFCGGDTSPFEPVAKRLQDNGNRLRKRGADFLLYSLLDMTIDQGFPVLEGFGQQLDYLEELILESANREILEKIHTLKRDLILLRRSLWPQREVINQLLRDEHAAIKQDTLLYLRDCYDHSIQVMDLLETYRDMSGSMLEIYLSSVSNHMNDIMRVLTVIATIFIPLTFIVGVYGMNFDRGVSVWNMPELGWPHGYLLIWGVMLTIAVSMLLFFRRRGWL